MAAVRNAKRESARPRKAPFPATLALRLARAYGLPMHRRLLLLAPLAAFISACARGGSNDAGQQVPATPPSPAIDDASASRASPAAATAGATSTSRADFTVVHWIHAKT